MTALRELVRQGYRLGKPVKDIADEAGTSADVVRVTASTLKLKHPGSGSYKPTETRPITLAGPKWSLANLPYKHKDEVVV